MIIIFLICVIAVLLFFDLRHIKDSIYWKHGFEKVPSISFERKNWRYLPTVKLKNGDAVLVKSAYHCGNYFLLQCVDTVIKEDEWYWEEENMGSYFK